MIDPMAVALLHREQFTTEFMEYLPDNRHVYDAFELEANIVLGLGFKHYSARTIVEVLRHHSAIEERGTWKINDHHTPYLARLFALRNPRHANLFEYRITKAVHRPPTQLELEFV